VYVPNTRSDTVDVISQRTFKIVEHFAVGTLPQHVTPAWDLRTLYVTNDLSNSLTPIDPRTGRPGRPIAVLDPYNLYFTPSGRWAIVVAEADRQLDFRDPHTMALHHALRTPQCVGIDHMDFTAGGRYAVASCEFSGRVIVVNLRTERVVKTIALSTGAMPQERQALARRANLLRRRHGAQRRVADRRAHPAGQALELTARGDVEGSPVGRELDVLRHRTGRQRDRLYDPLVRRLTTITRPENSQEATA